MPDEHDERDAENTREEGKATHTRCPTGTNRASDGHSTFSHSVRSTSLPRTGSGAETAAEVCSLEGPEVSGRPTGSISCGFCFLVPC